MAESQWGAEHPKTTAIRHSYMQAQKKQQVTSLPSKIS